jgi:hypothetical protein
VVVLGEVEGGRVEDLRGDRAETALAQGPLIGRPGGLGGGALGGRSHVDPGAVLGADIVALAHALRRVVALEERLEQRLEGDDLRVVSHEHDLVVPRAARADLLVGGSWA